jgi:WD40 repeat protein
VFVNTKFSIAADFLADGKHIVVGSENGDVILFDLQSSGGKVSQRLSAHDDAVLAVSAHDSYPVLATGGMTADRRVEFWTTPRFMQQQ